MSKLLTTPVDELVRHIVKGSYLDNSPYQYVHIARIGKAMDNNVYPLLTSATRLMSFNRNEIFSNVTVAIVFPFDNERFCFDDIQDQTILQEQIPEQLLDSMIISQIQLHSAALHEIAMWIVGKNKVPGTNRPLDPDYKLRAGSESFINVFFGREDPEGNDDFRNRATIYEALLSQSEIIAVELNLSLRTENFSKCCPMFSPDPYDKCELGEAIDTFQQPKT